MGSGKSPQKGCTKAASELIRTTPNSQVTQWTHNEGGLETSITLRARAHPVDFRLEISNFPKAYKASPSQGTIQANASVEVKIRFSIPKGGASRGTGRVVCSNAMWTDLRVRVRRKVTGDHDDEDSELSACVDFEEHVERKMRRRSRGGGGMGGGLREGRAVAAEGAMFCRTLRLQPLPAVEDACCICFEDMCTVKHGSGSRSEKLFALKCGHVYHFECISECAMSTMGDCGCGCGGHTKLHCALCREALTDGEYFMVSGRSRIGQSDFFYSREEMSHVSSETGSSVGDSESLSF